MILPCYKPDYLQRVYKAKYDAGCLQYQRPRDVQGAHRGDWEDESKDSTRFRDVKPPATMLRRKRAVQRPANLKIDPYVHAAPLIILREEDEGSSDEKWVNPTWNKYFKTEMSASPLEEEEEDFFR